MAKKKLPSIDDLRCLLSYCEDTGVMVWRDCKSSGVAMKQPKVWDAMRSGNIAGYHCKRSGYLTIQFRGVSMLAHRVAWAIQYGYWPKGQIDHIDGDRSNNIISNLRDVSPLDNSRNKAKHKNNTTGHTGVYKKSCGLLYYSQITVMGKTKHLGTFSNIGEAISVRKSAEARIGFTDRHGE